MNEIWRLPVPSTGLLGDGVDFEERPRREVALRYEVEGSAGEVRAEAIVFEGVEAYRCTYGVAKWMLVAYDRLVEVTDSAWATEVIERLRKQGEAEVPLRHLMIYFDDGPCYEVICRAFRIEA